MKIELANTNDFKVISALAGYIAEELSAEAFAKRSIEDRELYSYNG